MIIFPVPEPFFLVEEPLVRAELFSLDEFPMSGQRLVPLGDPHFVGLKGMHLSITFSFGFVYLLISAIERCPPSLV